MPCAGVRHPAAVLGWAAGYGDFNGDYAGTRRLCFWECFCYGKRLF
ncbi:MAG: hypothetical protein IT373_36290 [Polyangiaceae bacterium]|nr:hypothetical protein [Polyangiaceae bacterium]